MDRQMIEVNINMKIVGSKDATIAKMLERIDGMTITSIDEGDWQLTLSEPVLITESNHAVQQVQIGGKNNQQNIK